jgi:tetratricopeptide (TPR) repeat protein
VAAGYLAVHPRASMATLAARLRDTRLTLATLDGGGAASNVRAVFSWSYQQLDACAARVFRLLSIHPGPDISASAVASTAGIALGAAQEALETLTRAHLLIESAPGRFGFHDLLRAYATELADAQDDEEQRRRAGERMLDHYLHTAMRATRAISPNRERLAVADPGAGVVIEDLADLAQALRWCGSERCVLVAVIGWADAHGFPVHAYQTAWAATVYFMQGSYWSDWLTTQRIALAAAQSLGDTDWQARAQRNIGLAHAKLGQEQEGATWLGRALALQIEHGYRLGEASTREAIATFYDQYGRFRAALEHATRALEIYQELGHRPGTASALNAVGWFHSCLGDYPRALDFCTRALDLQRELDDRYTQGALWDSLGYIRHKLGDHAEAVSCYTRALELFREFGGRYQIAETLEHLGDALGDAGDAGAADSSWKQALVLLEELGRPEAEALRRKLLRP